MTWVLAAAAALAVVTGALPLDAAGAELSRVWSVVAFLVAVTIVAELADGAGLFDAAAHTAARAGRGRVLRLWLLVVVLATATTVLLSLDTTAVLLTPVVIALAQQLDLSPVPFAMTTVWLANTASLLLPVSNLTNLLAVQKVGWSAVEWASRMWLPALTSIAVSVAVLWLLHRRELRGRYRPAAPRPPGDRALLVLAGLDCAVLGVAVAAGVQPWIAAGVAAAVLVTGYLLRRPSALRPALLPWQLVVVTVSIFLVVAALDRHGLGTLLRDLAGQAPAAASGTPWTGFVDRMRVAATGAGASNVVNNLPAYLAVEPAASTAARLPALVAGTNAGPLVTVWASLATLLWRARCRSRGVEIRAGRFALEGSVLLVVLMPAVVAALAVTT